MSMIDFFKKKEPSAQQETSPAVDGFAVLSERIGKEEVQKAIAELCAKGLYEGI